MSIRNPLLSRRRKSFTPGQSVMANYAKKKVEERKICDVMAFFTHGLVEVLKSKKRRGELSINNTDPLKADVLFVTSSILGEPFALKDTLQPIMAGIVDKYSKECSYMYKEDDL
jgi:hypothetical protein